MPEWLASTLSQAALVLLGWSLGLLGTLGFDLWRTRRRRKEVSAGLRTELNQLRYQLAGAVFPLARQLEVLDATVIEWLRHTFDDCDPDEELWKLRQALHKLKGSEQGFVKLLAQLFDAEADPAQVLVRYDLPFFDANLDAVSRYSPDTRRLLLLTRSQVHIVNEKIDLIAELMRMTFDPSIGDENHRRVRSNLQAAYSDICQRARRTADLIGDLQRSI